MTDKKDRFSGDDIRELRQKLFGEPARLPSTYKTWVADWASLNSTATQSQTLNGATPYTVTLTGSTTNPTLGTDGLTRGWFLRLGGGVMIGGGTVIFGPSGFSKGSGFYYVSLPAPLSQNFVTLGSFTYFDGGSNKVAQGGLIFASPGNRAQLFYPATHLGDVTLVTDVAPWTAVSGGTIEFQFLYQALQGT